MPTRRIPLLRPRLMLTVLLFLAAAALGGPRAADAADQFTFKGLGYGHGVGMSQWGAWAGAKDGATFDEILAFYYPGTSIADPIDDVELTVKLSSKPWASLSSLTQDYARVVLSPVGASMTLVMTPPSGPERVETIPVGGNVSCVYGEGGVKLVSSVTPGYQGPFTNVEARPADGDRVRVELWTTSLTKMDPREYWGKIRLARAAVAGKLNAFNVVRIESYLRSIGEVPADWAQPTSSYYAIEAVKAQAVAARSYAMTHKDPYIDDNQYDQVYYGYTGNSPPTSAPFELRSPGIPLAAEQTAGKVVRYNGGIISTFFSSHSGGHTTDTRVWGSNPSSYPYLKAKPDPWSLAAPPSNPGPGYPWSFTISAADLTSKTSGLVNVGTITGVAVQERDTTSSASHVRTLRITGTKGSATVSADSFRAKLGWGTMRSTLITSINGVGDPSPTPSPERWVSQVVVTSEAPGSTKVGSQSLTPIEFDTSTIGATVNVRSGPGTGYEKVATLAPNTSITAYAWQHGESVSGDERWYRLDKPIHRVFTGPDRYATAILVSRESYPSGSVPAVVLAKGDDFPDALASAPLAAAHGGPIILTPSTGLTSAVKAELQRLAPGKVFFVGLPSKVLTEVKTLLPGEGRVVPLVGVDRYHTATLIADELKKVRAVSKIVLVPGDTFPDALSVAPVAANKGWAVLLTPQAGPLPKVTSSKIEALGVTSALVVGTKVKPPPSVTEVVSKVGADRYQTSVLVAQYGKSQGLSFARTGYVTGENYPDGLVSGPWLAKDSGLVLVTRSTTVPSYVKTLLLTVHDELVWMDFAGLPGAGVSAVMGVVR